MAVVRVITNHSTSFNFNQPGLNHHCSKGEVYSWLIYFFSRREAVQPVRLGFIFHHQQTPMF